MQIPKSVSVVLPKTLEDLLRGAKTKDGRASLSKLLGEAAVRGFMEMGIEPMADPDAPKKAPLDDLTQKMGDALLAAKPEALAKIQAETEAAIVVARESKLPPGYKATNHGVNPEVRTEVKEPLLTTRKVTVGQGTVTKDQKSDCRDQILEEGPLFTEEPEDDDPMASLFRDAEKADFGLEDD